ncbi:MAG TPA: MlaD family protein, partial [Nocardioides sp.]|nr:MlaD family protein [Nocardioides sp.]
MPRAGLDKKTSQDLLRLLCFVLTTGLATSLLVITIGNLSFRSTHKYEAIFSDAAGVNKGDDIRVAGVRVGTVKDISITKDNQAEVTFSVDSDVRLDDATHAQIKYRNLLGQRYISLYQQGTSDTVLPSGGTLPVTRTKPALNLTVLFNGFKPLFAALSPDDINKLSYEIVQVFQGEGGTLQNLLSSTASVTQTLADRDKVIGQLLDNLSYVLNHVASRDHQLGRLIVSFKRLVTGLDKDRGPILGSLNSISALSVQTASLVQGLRPPFVADIHQLRSVATNLDNGKQELDRALQVLPIKLNKIGRTATYGSWFNFYLCHFVATVRMGKHVLAQPTVNIGA